MFFYELVDLGSNPEKSIKYGRILIELIAYANSGTQIGSTVGVSFF
jgi:hypothetical protein